MGFLRYMRESIGKRLTVKHLTTVCLQSDKGQVKQLSLYSHTVFFAAFRRTLRATVHFGAHIRESGALIRSCARTHLSVLIWEHLLPKSSRSRSTVIVVPMLLQRRVVRSQCTCKAPRAISKNCPTIAGCLIFTRTSYVTPLQALRLPTARMWPAYPKRSAIATRP